MHKSRFACFTLVLFVTSLVPSIAFAQYNPGFVGTRTVPVGGNPWALATADLNHDGILDAVIADGSTTAFDTSGVPHTTIHGVAVLLGKGGGAYQPAVHYATTDSASFVSIADVDGDGSPDILTASYDLSLLIPGGSPGGSLEILRNHGDGTFGAPTLYTFPGWYATAVYPGDLNLDGRVDLVVGLTSTTIDSHATQIMLNNGTFRAAGFQTVGVMPVAVADFNRDGRPDVATLAYHQRSQNSFEVMFGDGAGGFRGVSGATNVPPIDTNFAVALADMNNDGWLDVVYTSDDASAITVLLNTPAGGPFTTATTLVIPELITGVTVGDFNHDGRMDVATTNEHANAVVRFGNGDGTFAFPAFYDISGNPAEQTGSLTAVDLNHDGILDVATLTPNGNFLPVFGKPGGTFNASTESDLGTRFSTFDSLTADFNRDGIRDLAILCACNSTSSLTVVKILLGQGNGRFKAVRKTFATAMAGWALAATDINHDGKIDLVVRNQVTAFNNPEFSILQGFGDGTFADPVQTGTMPFLSGNIPQEPPPFYVADVNNDGNPDFVTFDGVHLGAPGEAFAPPIPFPDSNYLFALGDFNKDGKLDLVTLSDARAPALNVYLGSGNGHFAAGTFSIDLPFGDLQHNYLAVGHFTRDGNLGVIAGSNNQFYPDTVISNGGFSLLAGNGDGTLKAPVIYQVPHDLWKLAVGDFNGDGLDDVAAFNANSNLGAFVSLYQVSDVSLFTSRGDGTLFPPVNVGAGNVSQLQNPGNVPIADFNRDGAVDIAADVGSRELLLMNSRGTSVTLTASPASSTAGQPVTLKCTVAASFHFSGTLFGRVAFHEGNTVLGTVDIVNGAATLTTSSLAAGTHTLIATFLGNGNYNAHRSNAATIVIAP